MKKACVYILRCSDGTYYTGCATNLEKRLFEHHNALYPSCYTASRRPVALVWCSEFSDLRNALSVERQIKKWSQAKKEALIRGDIEELKLLARSTKTKMSLVSLAALGRSRD